MCVCEKHRSAPAIIYGGCAGCEIEGLRARVAELEEPETGALHLLARIREALGDKGKRMQGELMDYCRELAALPARVAELEAFIVRVVDPVSLSPEDAAFVSRILEPDQDGPCPF